MASKDDIQTLQEFFDQLSPEFEIGDKLSSGLISLNLILGNRSFVLFVDDEYDDLEINNPLLNLYMVLRTLEIYKESDDFLDWSRELSVYYSDELRVYYMALDKCLLFIENKIGSIDSVISDLDYQLNLGAIQKMRNNQV